MKDLDDLRDEFAGQALEGILTARYPYDFNDAKIAAERAYDYADAMIEESIRRRTAANRLNRPDVLETPTKPS